MNNVNIIGRLVKEPKGKELSIAVPRPFKNEDGVYETDFFTVLLSDNIAEKVAEYLRKGDLVAIKGRLQSTENKIEIVTEKISFLSGKQKESEGE